MKIWETLGIEQTADMKAIRKAYAAQLKLHHPEDDPEGYQQLREAYDLAVKQAKWIQAAAVEDDAERNEQDTREHQLWPEPVSPAEQVQEDSLERFMDDVASLYADFPARINAECWTGLLKADIVWDLQLQPVLVNRLLYFLERHYFLPASVWGLLTRAFQWLDASQGLRLRYPNVFKYAYDKTYRAASMNYDALLDAGTIDREAYLRHRETAWCALLDNDLPAMKSSLDQAASMYDNDPDLAYLQAAYCWRKSDAKGALVYAERFVSVLPERYDHTDALLLAAAVFEKCRRTDKAKSLRARAMLLNPRGGEASMVWQMQAKISPKRVKLWFAAWRSMQGIQLMVWLIVLLAIVTSTISSFNEPSDGSHSIDVDDIATIRQIPGLEHVTTGSEAISLELTGLYFTGIQELVTNDGKEVRQYVVYEDPDSLTDLPHAANTPGYIFIGYNGDITYYVSANYELATVLAKSPKATIVGFKSTSLPEGLKAEVNEKGIDRPQELEAKPFRYLLAFSAEAR